MPRPPRLNLAGYPQHIVQRGHNRQPCFFSGADYQLYLDLLLIYCAKHQCFLHAYALMTNHVHLLVTPEIPDGVSLLFRDLGRDYVRRINRLQKRTGSLWEGRFRSSLIDTDAYCLACYRYIELNPVRAKMVSHPGDYPWSSFRDNASDDAGMRVTPHASWRQLGPTIRDCKRAYARLFESELDQGQIDDIRRCIAKSLPCGSDKFKADIEKASGITLGERALGRPKRCQFRK